MYCIYDMIPYNIDPDLSIVGTCPEYTYLPLISSMEIHTAPLENGTMVLPLCQGSQIVLTSKPTIKHRKLHHQILGTVGICYTWEISEDLRHKT